MKAGERAQDLTRQLLAFSRKQVLDVKVLDINRVVCGMEKMIGRLLGEDIEVRLILAENLGCIRADVSQLEQVLMNLCVNARDAMPDGGTLMVETGATYLNEYYIRSHPDAPPGPFITLSVSDTGAGMDETTQHQIFDPFFTTKEKGKGTGLGLATVYGIVMQHGGEISVYSEIGRGTTFRIYLPQVTGVALSQESNYVEDTASGAGQTILVVEDEPQVRRIICLMLSHLGYKVIEAATPEAAIATAAGSGKLDLLLTDVIMPEMNGRQLQEHILSIRPELKTLFMSGYTEEMMGRHGMLDTGIHFISKPFSEKLLSHKIHEVLDHVPGKMPALPYT